MNYKTTKKKLKKKYFCSRELSYKSFNLRNSFEYRKLLTNLLSIDYINKKK